MHFFPGAIEMWKLSVDLLAMHMNQPRDGEHQSCPRQKQCVNSFCISSPATAILSVVYTLCIIELIRL